MPEKSAIPAGCEILLLEDDGALRKRAAAYLRGLGAEVTECATLAEARRVIGAIRFEFALVDLHLPDGMFFSCYAKACGPKIRVSSS